MCVFNLSVYDGVPFFWVVNAAFACCCCCFLQELDRLAAQLTDMGAKSPVAQRSHKPAAAPVAQQPQHSSPSPATPSRPTNGETGSAPNSSSSSSSASPIDNHKQKAGDHRNNRQRSRSSSLSSVESESGSSIRSGSSFGFQHDEEENGQSSGNESLDDSHGPQKRKGETRLKYLDF